MKFDMLFQTKENNFKDELVENLKNAKKCYIFSIAIKENTLKIFEDIDKTKLYVYMGVEKKNTTKKILDTFLEKAEELYVYDNNNISEFVSGIVVLEYANEAILYNFNGSISEAKITTDNSVITKITFDLKDAEDKKEYKAKLKELLNLKNNKFNLVDEDLIDKLIKDKVIFSNMQYVHKVKSISDYIGEVKKDEPQAEKLPEVDLLDDDLDIDFDISLDEELITEEEEDIKEEVFEELEDIKEEVFEELEDEEVETSDETFNLNDLVLERADLDLEVTEIKEENKNKSLDLNNVSNYIFELPAKQKNKKDKGMLKIPNYIRTLVPNFFNIDKGEKKVIDGIEYRILDVKLDIIDAKNNSKYKDNKAMIMLKKGQTYFYFNSPEFENINYNENDIARVIKLSDDSYHIEFVSKDLEEYKIWKKITNIKFKGKTERLYGVM